MVDVDEGGCCASISCESLQICQYHVASLNVLILFLGGDFVRVAPPVVSCEHVRQVELWFLKGWLQQSRMEWQRSTRFTVQCDSTVQYNQEDMAAGALKQASSSETPLAEVLSDGEAGSVQIYSFPPAVTNPDPHRIGVCTRHDETNYHRLVVVGRTRTTTCPRWSFCLPLFLFMSPFLFLFASSTWMLFSTLTPTATYSGTATHGLARLIQTTGHLNDGLAMCDHREHRRLQVIPPTPVACDLNHEDAGAYDLKPRP
jgi:hypothetical protein